MVYGVFLRCIFCKKRDWLGTVTELPPSTTWDEPSVSIFDVVEMRGRKGMPLVCSTNWIYPQLKEKALEEFKREHKQMLATLTHTGLGEETLKQLEDYFGKNPDEKLGVVYMEGIGDVIVPKEFIQSFADLSRRVQNHETKYKAYARNPHTKNPKLFTIMAETPEERWRVYWNRLNASYGYLVQDGVIVLLNKYGNPIPNSSVNLDRAGNKLTWSQLNRGDYKTKFPQKLKKIMAVKS